MNYLKKNIPLLCFIVLTVIVALTVAVLDVNTYFGYKNAQAEAALYMEEIKSNSKKTPSYNRDNLKAIQEDTEVLRQRIVEVQSRYGKVHRRALRIFATELGTTEEQMLKDFREYHDKLDDKADNSGARDKEIFDGFMARYYTENGSVIPEKKKVFDAACENFYKYARKEYIEYRKIPGSEFRCILEALGLPLTDRLSNLRNILEGNNSEWVAIIPGLRDIASAEDQEKHVKGLLIAYDSLGINQLGLAYRQIQIKQDIFKRMTAAKIIKVESLTLVAPADAAQKGGSNTPSDPLEGVKKDKYLYYRYEIKFSGTMSSIRDFLNNLSNAHTENRIYNIRDLQLYRNPDEEKPESIKKAFSEGVGKVDKDGKVSDTYGLTLIGKNPAVTCVIVVDYIIYVDDMIQRTKIETKK